MNINKIVSGVMIGSFLSTWGSAFAGASNLGIGISVVVMSVSSIIGAIMLFNAKAEVIE